jgi:hypothetical protein
MPEGLHMIIEETVLIKADINKIWKTFTELATWPDWNTVVRNAVTDSGRFLQGEQLTFSLKPFSVSITLNSTIEEVVPSQRIVWSGSKFGIFSRHEFLFQQLTDSSKITSRETFSGLPLLLGGLAFPADTVRELVIAMLNDLKKVCEKKDT